jgi:hypothetical protein
MAQPNLEAHQIAKRPENAVISLMEKNNKKWRREILPTVMIEKVKQK